MPFSVVIGVVLIIMGAFFLFASPVLGLIVIIIGVAVIASEVHKTNNKPAPVIHAEPQRPEPKASSAQRTPQPKNETVSQPVPKSVADTSPHAPAKPDTASLNEKNSTALLHTFSPSIIPRKVENIPLAYRRFQTGIISQQLSLYEQMQKSGDFSVSAEEKDGKILLYYHQNQYALINDIKAEEMIKDWMKNAEPFLIYANSPNTVYVALYRDKRLKLANHEHSVIKLTAFSSNSKQETISFLEEGEELDLEEDYDNNGNDIVMVFGQGEEIGRLPKKHAAKVIIEGAAGCFLHHIETDVEKDKYIPFVEIYW